MKKLKNSYIITAMLVGLGLSSCVKKFDPSSYAPKLNVNGYTASNAIASSNLVAYWGFNSSLKDSLSGTAGIATGTSFSAGLVGLALQGANNSYVISDVPAAVQNLHSFSISTWYNMPENTNGVVNLVDIVNDQNFWGNLDIFIENPTATTGNLKVHLWNNGTSTTGVDAWEGDYTINNPFNGWRNILVTYNDTTSTVNVYYQGSSVGSNTQKGFAPLNWTGVKKMVFGTLQFQTNPTLTSGADNPGFASYLTGELDEVKIYNRVLTPIEVSSMVGLQIRGK